MKKPSKRLILRVLAAPVRLELTTLGLTGSPINTDSLLISHRIQNNYPKYTQI